MYIICTIVKAARAAGLKSLISMRSYSKQKEAGVSYLLIILLCCALVLVVGGAMLTNTSFLNSFQTSVQNYFSNSVSKAGNMA